MNQFSPLRFSRVIRYASEEVKAWAGLKLNTTFREPATALGLLDGQGHLAGAIIFNDYDAANVEMTPILPKGFVGRGMLREIFSYAFDELGVSRVSMTIAETEPEVIRQALRWGWQIEGRKRCYFGPGEHAIILGMLRDECRFLRAAS